MPTPINKEEITDYVLKETRYIKISNGWKIIVPTMNWAGDVYVATGKTIEECEQKVIKNIKKNLEDAWMLQR